MLANFNVSKIGTVNGIELFTSKDFGLVLMGGVCSTVLDGYGHSIIVSKMLKDFLTEDELFAVIFHELGHIYCGHLDVQGYAGEVIIREDFEKEADRFACNYADPAVLLKALEKLSKLVLRPEFSSVLVKKLGLIKGMMAAWKMSQGAKKHMRARKKALEAFSI